MTAERGQPPASLSPAKLEGKAASASPANPGAEPELPPEERQRLLAELHELQGQLAKLQGETPLIMPSVHGQAVSAVVAYWTGIPVARMVKNEIESVLNLADTLNQRIIGQRHALEMIAKRIQTSRVKTVLPRISEEFLKRIVEGKSSWARTRESRGRGVCVSV